MVKINCGLDFIFCEARCVGIVIDLSCMVEKSISALDAMMENKTQAVLLTDDKQKKSVVLCIGEKCFDFV